MQNTTGGNWKEMVHAASIPGGGDLAVVQYHLEMGMDPNWQHPECMSTPLLEAIRAGNRKVVKLLLEHTPNTADPTVPGDWEGQTPMELAMERKDHAVVDLLLPFLPKEYENECKTVLLTGTTHREMVTQFLELGHCVVVGVDKTDEDTAAEAETLRKETGNRKLFWLSVDDLEGFLEMPVEPDYWTPYKVDVWIHKTGSTEGFFADFTAIQESIAVGRSASKMLLLIESKDFAKHSTQLQLSWLLTQDIALQSNIFAMVEPTKWWHAMTYAFWSKTWCVSTARLLGLVQKSAEDPHVADDYGIPGTVYSYRRHIMSLPSAADGGIAASQQDEWKKQLDPFRAKL